MSRIYLIEWSDEVSRYIKIEANSEEEAREKWENGDYNIKHVMESDCQQLSDLDISEDN